MSLAARIVLQKYFSYRCTRLVLPSAFTPNSDGINDIFRLKGSGFVSADMLILDQWGQLIFRTNNAVVGWDGSVKEISHPMELIVTSLRLN